MGAPVVRRIAPGCREWPARLGELGGGRRRSVRWGIPADAVDGRKQARIKRIAGAWLGANRPGQVSIRFDVVSVTVRDGDVRVEQLPDAFF